MTGALALGLSEVGGDWLLAAASVNLGIGVWTLMPIPTLDGAVIWRSVWPSARPGRD